MEGILPTGSPEGDRTALVALYQGTDGENWAHSWDIAGDISTWYGVTVNGEGSVVKLSLGTNNLKGTIPAALGQLSKLETLDLSRNELEGPLPTVRQLVNLHTAINPWKSDDKGMKDSRERPGLMAVKGKPNLPRTWEGAESTDDSPSNSEQSMLMGISGTVVAWSLGPGSETLGAPDFELEVPERKSQVPAIISVSTSSTERDGMCLLLHPVVTGLTGVGVSFDPPLSLRFPVGDMESMVSGSDNGSGDDEEERYRAYLEKTYMLLVQEEGSFEWERKKGDIVKRERVFFLEISVDHFSKYALAKKVEPDGSGVALVDIKRLPHESRKHVFLFVNRSVKTIAVYCWNVAQPQKHWFKRVAAAFSLGLEGVGVNAELERERVGIAPPMVWDTTVKQGGSSSLRQTSLKKVLVAWATENVQQDHRLMQVWGVRELQHKQALVFFEDAVQGACRVQDLKVDSGVDAGKMVKDALR